MLAVTTLKDVISAVDTTWVIVAGVLVLFMQAGFMFLEIGFSRQKTAYGRDLAAHFLEGRLSLAKLRRMEDEAAIEALSEVKGIGRWSAEVFLLFALQRPDVMPAQDLALLIAAQRLKGLRARPEPKKLLKQAGFAVKDVPEGHICCGSAGTYNLLQPEIAGELRARKVANIERTKPDLIATGNIGCLTQIGKGTAIPIVHTVELLDWATGGPTPDAIERAGLGERGGAEGLVAAE